MTRWRVVTGLALLMVAAGLTLAPARHAAPPDTVYTVAQVVVGRRRNPMAWGKRTVLVRGIVGVTHCELYGCGGFPLCSDPACRVAFLWAMPAPAGPVVRFLRSMPLVSRFAPVPQEVRYGLGVYRITLLPPCGRMRKALPRCADALLPDAAP